MNNSAETKTAQTEEVPTPEIMLDTLSTKFDRGDMSVDLDELHGMAEAVDADGKERGFDDRLANHFVDANGNLIVIARKEGEEKSSYAPPAGDKTCRIFIDGVAIEVAVPPEWQRHTLQFHNDEMAADVIYDLGGADLATLPSGMRQLVDKFGTKLSIEATPDPEEIKYIEGIAVGLDDIKMRLVRRADERKGAEEEAHRIESDAVAAANRVKKGLFMSAKRLADRRDAAYRDSILKSTGRHHQ